MHTRSTLAALCIIALHGRVASAQSGIDPRGPRPRPPPLMRNFDEGTVSPAGSSTAPATGTPLPRAPTIVRDFDDNGTQGPGIPLPGVPQMVRDFDDAGPAPRTRLPLIVRDYEGHRVPLGPPRRLRPIREYEPGGTITVEGDAEVELGVLVITGTAPRRASPDAADAGRTEGIDAILATPRARRRRRVRTTGPYVSLAWSERVVPLVSAVSTRAAPLVGGTPFAHGALLEVGARTSRTTQWGAFVGAYGQQLPGAVLQSMVRVGALHRRATSSAPTRAWLQASAGVGWMPAPANIVWFEPAVGVGVSTRVARGWELFATLDAGLALGMDRAAVQLENAGGRATYVFSLGRAGLEIGVRALP